MRYQGRITEWNDVRGFGFIVWNGGGDKVFVHVSAFNERQRGPSVGDIVTYEMQNDEKGQRRAEQVAFVIAESRKPAARSHRRSQLRNIAAIVLIAAVCFVAYQRSSQRAGSSALRIDATQDSVVPEREAFAELQPDVKPTFQCEGKTRCSQMTSCAEATFYLENCPDTKMDGDNDGVPCESQWCGQ
ncbi:MAG: excalibur calcium-binding domain-containing protein [Dokdonella sp.]